MGTETPEHLSPVAQEPFQAPVQAPVQAPAQAPPPAWATKPQITYLPPPTGPNWGLVVIGLVFAVIGAGVVANQVAGFEVSSLSELGPSVLVIAGLVCALLGIIGILTRRRRG
jgi:LPXTG-motif cell wall-anchored protein